MNQTMNIYKHVMSAPDDEALTLSPAMLGLLKELLISDTDNVAADLTSMSDELYSLRSENHYLKAFVSLLFNQDRVRQDTKINELAYAAEAMGMALSVRFVSDEEEE